MKTLIKLLNASFYIEYIPYNPWVFQQFNGCMLRLFGQWWLIVKW
jgi:hypothetical protein